jgi:hypothetical protein
MNPGQVMLTVVLAWTVVAGLALKDPVLVTGEHTVPVA